MTTLRSRASGAFLLFLVGAQRLPAQGPTAGLRPVEAAPVTVAAPALMRRRTVTSGERAALVGLGIGIVVGAWYALGYRQHNPLVVLGAGIVIGLPLAVIAALLFGKGASSP